MIALWNTMFNEPIRDVPIDDGYFEQLASDRNLGFEALKLLRDMPEDSLEVTDVQEWLEKRRQLLETWKVNTDAAGIKADAGPVPEEIEVSIDAECDRNPRVIHRVSSKSQLFDIQEIVEAANDWPGWDFKRYSLSGNNLVVVHEDTEDLEQEPPKQRVTLIATLSKIPPWLHLQQISQT